VELAREPALAPRAELADDGRELLSRPGEAILGAAGGREEETP
jgi:hypothetical protein